MFDIRETVESLDKKTRKRTNNYIAKVKELKEKARELPKSIDKVSAQAEKSGAQLNKITSQTDDVVEMQKKISDKESNYKFKSAVMNYRTLLDHKKTKRRSAMSLNTYAKDLWTKALRMR